MFQQYQKIQKPAELRPYVPGEAMDGISVTELQLAEGSPKEGDMIARDPSNPNDQWLVTKSYFEQNFFTTPLA